MTKIKVKTGLGHSENYRSMNIMWEELTDDKEVKRWHVGLVWES